MFNARAELSHLRLREAFGLVERQHLEPASRRTGAQKSCLQNPLHGLPKNQAINPPGRPKRSNSQCSFEMAEPWPDRAEVSCVIVSDTRSPHPVKPTFQYGGEAKPPSGKNKNQRLGGKQTTELFPNISGIEQRSVIAFALTDGEEWREAGPVKIFDLHLMAACD